MGLAKRGNQLSPISAAVPTNFAARPMGLRSREMPLFFGDFLVEDSAATARIPPGRRSFTQLTSKWMARMRRSRMRRTVPRPPVRARLRRTGGFRHTTNSLPTGTVCRDSEKQSLNTLSCYICSFTRTRMAAVAEEEALAAVTLSVGAGGST